MTAVPTFLGSLLDGLVELLSELLALCWAVWMTGVEWSEERGWDGWLR